MAHDEFPWEPYVKKYLTDDAPAAPIKAALALNWFGSQRNLSLSFYSPIYCDDDDQSEEWRVTKESGSINDREWHVIGRGPTPLAAIENARSNWII